MKAETKKRIKIQSLIFLILFILAEIALRFFGMKAGTLIDDFSIEDHPKYLKRFVSDEMGINTIYPYAQTLMLGTVINEQGFRGNYPYTRAVVDSIRKCTGRKIVMIVGDSYVEGCCADTVTNSFPDLIGRGPAYEVLNFGVSGTDPLQYELVVKKYAKELVPDAVVVAFYFGNDFLTYERKPSPGVPLTFPFKENKWIYGIPPNHLSKKSSYAFKTPEEAYDFYMTFYTLRGRNRNWFQKALSYSVIVSKIYLFIEHKMAKWNWAKLNEGQTMDIDQMTYDKVKNIKSCCDSLRTKCLFTGIPSPTEGKEGAALMTKYKNFFKDQSYHVPVNLTEDDYDGTSSANHFNNKGHRKYAEFLLKLLNSQLEPQHDANSNK